MRRDLRRDVDVFSERSLRRRRHLRARRLPEVGRDALQLRHRLLLEAILERKKSVPASYNLSTN